MWATADAETTGEIYETVPEPYVSRVDEIRWSPKKKKKKKNQDGLSRNTFTLSLSTNWH